jgi:hypothetical protein
MEGSLTASRRQSCARFVCRVTEQSVKPLTRWYVINADELGPDLR